MVIYKTRANCELQRQIAHAPTAQHANNVCAHRIAVFYYYSFIYSTVKTTHTHTRVCVRLLQVTLFPAAMSGRESNIFRWILSSALLHCFRSHSRINGIAKNTELVQWSVILIAYVAVSLCTIHNIPILAVCSYTDSYSYTYNVLLHAISNAGYDTFPTTSSSFLLCLLQEQYMLVPSTTTYVVFIA